MEYEMIQEGMSVILISDTSIPLSEGRGLKDKEPLVVACTPIEMNNMLISNGYMSFHSAVLLTSKNNYEKIKNITTYVKYFKKKELNIFLYAASQLHFLEDGNKSMKQVLEKLE